MSATPGKNLNKSTLSAINHKSEYLSDLGDVISAYTSRNKPALIN